LGLAEETPSVA